MSSTFLQSVIHLWNVFANFLSSLWTKTRFTPTPEKNPNSPHSVLGSATSNAGQSWRSWLSFRSRSEPLEKMGLPSRDTFYENLPFEKSASHLDSRADSRELFVLRSEAYLRLSLSAMAADRTKRASQATSTASDQVFIAPDESSSTVLLCPPSGSTDLTECSSRYSLDESLILAIISSLQSKTDDMSDSDSVEDFHSFSTLNTSAIVDSASADWLETPDASWRSEVANAMEAFRASEADQEDNKVLPLRPEQTDRVRSRQQMSIGKDSELRLIQDWRNNIGDEGMSTSTVPLAAKYELKEDYRFPRSPEYIFLNEEKEQSF